MKVELTNSLKQVQELSARLVTRHVTRFENTSLVLSYSRSNLYGNPYRNSELEAQVSAAHKETHSCQEQLTKLKNQLHEVRSHNHVLCKTICFNFSFRKRIYYL